MNKKKVLLLGLGLCLVIVLLFSGGEEKAPAVSAKAPVVIENKILVAKHRLPQGLFLKSDHVEWVSWPKNKVHAAYITKKESLPDTFYKSVVRFPLTAGEPLTEEKIVHPGQRGFLAATLPSGMRAVSIKVKEDTGISGFVFPGDRVDVLLTQEIRNPDDEQRPMRYASETLLTNLRVLAVDQSFKTPNEANPNVAKTVTLEVSPEHAEVIAVAQDLGDLSLSLRSLSVETSEEAKRVLANSTNTVMNDADADLLSEFYFPDNKKTYTWDADASQMVGRSIGSNVVIMRGVPGSEGGQ